MRAILVRQFGGIDQMKVATDVAIPTPGEKQVSLLLSKWIAYFPLIY